MKRNSGISKMFSVILSLTMIAGVLSVSSMSISAVSSANPFAGSDAAYLESLRNSRETGGDSALHSAGVQESVELQESAGVQESAVPGAGSSNLNRCIMEFLPDCSMRNIYDLIKGYEFKVIGNSSNRVFTIKSDESLEAIKAKFGEYCVYVEKDIDLKPADMSTAFSEEEQTAGVSVMSTAPNDPYYAVQWYLSTLNIPAAWDLTTGAASVYVAVIDSGISRNQRDLLDADIRDGIDIVRGGAVIEDVSGHGTAVTGIIAAAMNNNEGIAGISSGVAIIPLCIENVDGTILSSNLAAAIYTAADSGCKVLNISLGGGYTSAVQEAVTYAYNKGGIIISSAGNDSDNTYNYPASCDGVISVGSVNQYLSRSYFSNCNDRVDVVAPGENICTTEDSAYTGKDYGYHDGTSFSSPCTAAVAALAVSRDSTLSPAEFASLLASSCTDLDVPGYDIYTGYGLVNAASLLEKIVYKPAVTYQSHVQDIGWQAWVENGAVSGTSGESKRLEAIQIRLENIDGGIEYKTHVQDIGWMDWAADGNLSGTSGQSKRLEAIQIRLTGAAANKYDVYYRVHAQNTGWMDWAKNGESSGTAGYGYRLEAIQVVFIPKGEAAPGATAAPFEDFNSRPVVSYQTHVQDIGWQGYVINGEVSGTSGESKRLEAIRIGLENISGSIEYRTHVQDIGWMDWTADNKLSGTSGLSKRLEAIEIRLTGPAADTYDIYYRVHAQNFGWLDWAGNGQSAGTSGFGYRLEAIQILIVKKGAAAPGPTARAYIQA